MSYKSDWVSYVVSLLYMTILIGSGLGFYRNVHKKRALLQINEYEKQRRVISWRFRFYCTLFAATLVRIIALLSAVSSHKVMILSKSVTQQEFIWSAVASISSLLYFTAFTFIIWFFAHLAFHQQLKYKRFITPFFVTLNVTLYVSAISIGISCMTSSKWELVYDFVLPLFAVCVWILAACFLFLSHKILSTIVKERQNTLEYMQSSRKISSTHSHQYSFKSALLNKGSIKYIAGSKQMVQMPPAFEPNMEQIQNETRNTQHLSPSAHIIPRLIKLSVLCALCWFIRGTYLMALRIWPSTDKSPFNIPNLAWEALFYLFTEYPPCLGALILMIAKPHTKGCGSAQVMQYPVAKQQDH